uniref:Transcription-repair coupling factor n=1 Tax=uncultured organism TaxID=155900 RepID=M1QBZ1_9ZZZZ|nr:transcription-repair coupling factor [uncultured organism]
MPADLFSQYSMRLKTGDEIDITDMRETLNVLGYEREEMVEQFQQFSVRGGIIDIYSVTRDRPCRIELFGDEIDSIRVFDPNTQRSIEEIEEIVIPPAREIILFPERINDQLAVIKKDYEEAVERLKKIGNEEEAEYLEEKSSEALEKLTEFEKFPGYEQFMPYFFEDLNTVFDYVDENTLLFLDNPEKIKQRVASFTHEINETQSTLLEQGSIILSYADNFPTQHQFLQELGDFRGATFTDAFQEGDFLLSPQAEFTYSTKGVEPYHGQLELLVERLMELKGNYKVVITLNSDNKVERIGDYLRENNLPAVEETNSLKENHIVVTSGSFSEGFIFEDIKLAVFTEKEVIGNQQKKKRQTSIIEEGVEISSLNELNPGDYVVHENHGIGKYMGVKTLEIQNRHQDYLVLKYADEDKLYVPTDKVNLVQKYIGTDSKPPKLYSLGSSEWKKVKQRVKNSVKEMAIGLLELYAERETVEGYAFSEDTVWQREFEDSFPYEETPDQMNAIEEVKKDMEDPTPMDRLLCGDVGYGKTEVAIRAAFKAAMDGKQTAVLVPTTILAQQHYNTFSERIEKYPINVEMISRFKTKREQEEILKKLAKGEVDIVIGTHRLLSEDVIFSDLGLLIIDEEQRFGVSHKEKLKNIKSSVDVLTLTATPIPRTLHMALVGVRDMSVIETPPENRYPIRTYIREFNEELVRETIRREMGRNGQVYFVHNRVEDIDKKADMVRRLVPEARVAVAHGQMNENRLERLMYNFYNNEYDVLVCTTIIENGLDIPNVNTIIINRADLMGLAQLYQLRGRVGRSSRVAYAYLLYESDRVLPEVAEKRLKAIKEFTNLGSGFKIAMRDLEIRGAGNLLGAEQHGHIASIGFSLYCKLLEGAIEELKGEEEESGEIELDFKQDAYIPDDYISDSKQKIEIYKKIKGVDSEREIRDIKDEINDRFGTPPLPVENLIKISGLGLRGRRLGIEQIKEKDNLINCYFRNMETLEGEAVVKLVDTFPGKIKVRSGKKPVLGVKTEVEAPLEFLEEVLEKLRELLTSN